MERYNQYFVLCARILMSIVFLLNGFGIINQGIPAKEMIERGVPPAIVPVAMLAGRLFEVAAGFGLAIGIFPRLCALALFAFLVPATNSKFGNSAIAMPLDGIALQTLKTAVVNEDLDLVIC